GMECEHGDTGGRRRGGEGDRPPVAGKVAVGDPGQIRGQRLDVAGGRLDSYEVMDRVADHYRSDGAVGEESVAAQAVVPRGHGELSAPRTQRSGRAVDQRVRVPPAA